MPASYLKIDLDAPGGVLMRPHKSGVDIYMYRADPGVYLNAFGAPVSDELAKETFGEKKFAAHRQAGTIKDRKAAAMAAIEAEFGVEREREVIAERDGFVLVGTGGDLFAIEAPDGSKLTAAPIAGKSAAVALFDKVVPKAGKPTTPAKA